MGVFINMSISKSVTREEWAGVYQEALDLVKAFPLAEQRQVQVRGIETMCLVRTEERKREYRNWRKEDVVEWGWYAHGDYETCNVAEDYFLPRDLVSDDSYEADAPDALYQELYERIKDYECGDPWRGHHYSLWGNKTQGEPYHMYLLAIGCLIAARLRRKAYVYGDITKGQCRKAVRMANEHLAEPIGLPDWCDPDRLFARIDCLPITEAEKLHYFISAYLGRCDAAFGAHLREHFSCEACDAYWEERLKECEIGTVGFRYTLKEYLVWGFGLEELCSLVRIEDAKDEDPYEYFVTLIMDSKLHLLEKDCTDIVGIDAEEEEPYGIGALLAQFFLSGARNKKVDRYIPLEEIRSALKAGIGERCPVDELIDAYLEKEAATDVVRLTGNESKEERDRAAKADPAQAVNDVLRARTRAEEKLDETYDVSRAMYLPFYEASDSINPALERNVCKYLEFYCGITSEDTYLSLMGEEPRERCLWLASENRYILLRDVDWEKIFDDIMDHPESFARYYPMVRVKITSDAVESVVRAFVTNDELWSHLMETAKSQA